MIILKNKLKRSLTIQLLKGAGLPGVPVVQLPEVETIKGLQRKPTQITVPPVVTLLAGQTSEPLPNAVADDPAISKLLSDPRSGLVLVKRTED